MRSLKFAMGYMPHRLWGNILQAQFLEKRHDREFYTPGEYIQNDPSTEAYGRLSPMQREIVQLLDAYSDRKLHKLFSKEKTVKLFQDKVGKEKIRDHIRPYIEKHMYRALEIARDNRIDVFVKEKSDRNIFPEDFVALERQGAVPLFSFVYREQLAYTLRIQHGGKSLVLKDTAVEVVSAMPLALLLGSSLYFVRDIDAKKLKPFLSRDSVLIPAQMEEKYFASFVRNTLRDFRTEVDGFEVEKGRPETGARLILEQGLHDLPVWILEFVYEDHVIAPDSPLQHFVDYSMQNGQHRFVRYPRDWEWEERMKNVLHACGLSSRDEKNFQQKESGGENQDEALYAAVNFMNLYGEEMKAAGFQVRQRLRMNFYLGPLSLQMESKEKEDWFDVYGVVRFGKHEVAFLDLKDHILQGRRDFELPGGELAILPLEWFSRYRAMFEFGQIRDGGIWIHKQHFSLVEGPVRDLHSETMEKLDQLNQVETIPEMPLPEGLQAELRDYQYEGFKWMCFLQEHGFGGCLADDMGLGKTLQAIAILLRAKVTGAVDGVIGAADNDSVGQLSLFGPGPEEKKEEKDGILVREKPTSLIVVPASLLHNWHNECRRFAPALKLCMHVGTQRNKDLSNFSYYDLIISTYHTVRQDIAKLSDFPFHYVILDESQMIKNPSSKLYQAITDLQARHRLVLTGTPIENSLTDLWAQINFVNPGLLGTLYFFRNSFVAPIEKKKDADREEKLKDLINPFVLRRTKEEVATELPPVYEQVRYCNMTEDQRRMYDEEKSQARNAILENLEEAGMEQSSIMVLQALTRLRQIANHPALVEPDEEGLDSGKFTEVLRNVESVLAEGHKVLIFSSFVKHLELFREVFDQERQSYAILTGSSSQKQREEAVREFQQKASCRLFLISLKAGGTGLNLTAADYVFILDPWWNPAAEMQALNRAHRIGQENKVFVYRFISSGTIEEKIQKLQERKRELAATFVTATNPLKDLSEKEMLELFG